MFTMGTYYSNDNNNASPLHELHTVTLCSGRLLTITDCITVSLQSIQQSCVTGASVLLKIGACHTDPGVKEVQ
jgi:hypothetical protein